MWLPSVPSSPTQSGTTVTVSGSCSASSRTQPHLTTNAGLKQTSAHCFTDEFAEK